MVLTLVVLRVTVGGLATVMDSLPEALNPVPASVTVMLRLSVPTVGLESLSVFKALFTTVKVPFKVRAFEFAPVTVRPVAAVTFKSPYLSEITAVITELAADRSVIDMPVSVVALLVAIVFELATTAGAFAKLMLSAPEPES